VLRQLTEIAAGKISLTGTMLRWYPAGGRYPSANWKVSVSGQPKFTGPNDQGYPTPQSRFWNRPGTSEEILNQFNESESPPPPPAEPPSMQGGCACGPAEDPFGEEIEDPMGFGGDVIF
jgi:transglutaminase-like putative cysteine protease